MQITRRGSFALWLAIALPGVAHGQTPSPDVKSETVQELQAGSFNKDWIVRPATSAFAVLVSAGKAHQTVTLPHDAMLELQRAPEHSSAAGYFPGGAFEYLKTFRVPEDYRGKRVTFQFEGVYRDAMVFINGEFAAQRPVGYSNFYVPANAFLRYGEANSIRVVARAHRDPRW
jgi:beta-galactosidase